MSNYIFFKKKPIITLFSSVILLFWAIGCKKTDKHNATGLKNNSRTSLEKVKEADFDEHIFDLPSKFELDGPPILNQGNTHKCTTFSGAYYILGLYNGLKSSSINTDIAGSVEFPHTQYKKINKIDCAVGNYIFDESDSDEIGMAEILYTYGTCSNGLLPFEDSEACTVVTSEHTEEAAKNKIGGYSRLDKEEFQNTAELKSWLYAGFPLWFSAEVEDNFQDLAAEDVWSSSEGKTEPHAMVIVGWDDEKNAFKIANSWGTEWSDKGYGWIDYDFLQEQLDVNPTIGIIYPNENQKAVFNKLTPSSCANANWGDIFIENKRNEEIAIEISNKNNTYTFVDAPNIDANEGQSFYGVAANDLKIKIFNKDKTTLIKIYELKVVQCEEAILTIK